MVTTKPEKPHRFEVADVVRAYGDEYRRSHHVTADQEVVLKHIAKCRTIALGGHREKCDNNACGHLRNFYNSCRDRHCPKCQHKRQAQWLAERLERMLPVPYFHSVFTLPDELNPICLLNKELIYNLLFATASQTLLQIARDDKHLGAQIGFTAVLHTWSQTLLLHPHLHCVVTGGGLSPDGTQWIPAKQDYLLPVQVLGALFRGKFLAALDQAYRDGKLELTGSIAELADPAAWRTLKDTLYQKDWVVYIKPPFDSTEKVFRYLSRYTHKVAISNRRIVDVRDGKVVFTYKDRTDESKVKQMTLGAGEFLRRFLLHVLPCGFMRIRHFGLCAGGNVTGKLEVARSLVTPQLTPTSEAAPSAPEDPRSMWEKYLDQKKSDCSLCPICKIGHMVRMGPAVAEPKEPHVRYVLRDTS